MQNPSADFPQSSFPRNGPVSFKLVNLFYSQNVPFDKMKIKHKICPPGLRKRAFICPLIILLVKNHQIRCWLFLLWCRVADKVEAAGTKIMKGKGIKGFPAPSSTTEPPQASFVQRRERHLRLFFRTNFQRGSFFMSGHNIEVILSIAHDGPLLTGD